MKVINMEKPMEISRPEYDMKAMGRKMKYYRRLRNLTVEDVRIYMQLSSVQAIYKWESGMCFPSADNLMALAELYQVNPVELMPRRELACGTNRVEGMRIMVECNSKKSRVDYMICA